MIKLICETSAGKSYPATKIGFRAEPQKRHVTR